VYPSRTIPLEPDADSEIDIMKDKENQPCGNIPGLCWIVETKKSDIQVHFLFRWVRR